MNSIPEKEPHTLYKNPLKHKNSALRKVVVEERGKLSSDESRRQVELTRSISLIN